MRTLLGHCGPTIGADGDPVMLAVEAVSVPFWAFLLEIMDTSLCIIPLGGTMA